MFVGQKVRDLRLQSRLDQADMARLLGISVSYLSQLENNDRPLTARVKAALAAAFPLDWSDFDARPEEQLLGAFNWALANPGHRSPPPDPERTERLHVQYPEFAARYVELHHALRQTEGRLAMAEQALGNGLLPGARATFDQVSDRLRLFDNYFHDLDTAAEDLATQLSIGARSDAEGTLATLSAALRDEHDCTVSREPLKTTLLRAPSPDGRTLHVNDRLPAASIAFQLASHIVHLRGLADSTMRGVIAQHPVGAPADALLHHALVNYGAAALLMPYGLFRETARTLRHDVDALAARFGVSIEQVAHRLATLQRPGQRGIPFFFCRIDPAGNITKRHSATRLDFGSYGPLCPRLRLHEAPTRADYSGAERAEMPDGVHYILLARAIARPDRRHAIVLACERDYAAHLAWADGLDLADDTAVTPIGPGCRLCPREGCPQRAFPPIDRPIHVERDGRHVIPYSIG
ncbi:helix-turn-helix domain-containing protein [Sphingobium sp. B1D7B]|uniref:helix-turn-helix domain-containing protein n=1 Tax=Sphingobium sp. B1D7B TaxID=2940578 RepID=UPI00222594ED|nr:helix-turn-helix transcriptional regulator [Sphingobium sp. B1D7B]MCW2391133.1 putative transcriptional regulator/transcriptional regulator with XRE-family HTH domain [Sphingobium sp. B11D3A]